MSVGSKVIGFIGAGAMAEAILAGIIKAKLVHPDHVVISDINAQRLAYLTDLYNVRAVEDNNMVVQKADVIILAVKPYLVKDVLTGVASSISDRHLLISVAAGLSTGYLASCLKERVPIVRVMPNTPSLVGAGASALSAGESVSDEAMELAKSLFDSVGRSVIVRESDMDAVTGISGSGPAYMYLIIEALADAGVKAGLARSTAIELAAQTMMGAAKMVLETGDHPAVLKDKVTTPGGTTITGLHVLEQGNIRATLIDAVLAAARRSQELGVLIK